MHIALWVVQALLALLFAAAGATKLFTPIPDLQQMGMGGWLNDSPGLFVRFVGLSELLGAIGLIAPAATGIAPKLTPAAATGLGLTMVCAAATHAAYGELVQVPTNLVIGALAGFVIWGRTSARPIPPRS